MVNHCYLLLRVSWTKKAGNATRKGGMKLKPSGVTFDGDDEDCL